MKGPLMDPLMPRREGEGDQTKVVKGAKLL